MWWWTLATAMAVELSVAHPGPGLLQVMVTESAPDSAFWLVAGRPGPGPCLGATCAGVLDPRVVASGTTDADGEWRLTVPASPPPGLALQALQIDDMSWPVALSPGGDACAETTAAALETAAWTVLPPVTPAAPIEMEDGAYSDACSGSRSSSRISRSASSRLRSPSTSTAASTPSP